MTTTTTAPACSNEGRTSIADGGLRVGAMAFIGLILGACATAGPGAEPGAAVVTTREAGLPPPNVAFTRRYAGVAVPFPSGNWTLVSQTTIESESPAAVRQALWASTAGGVVDRLVAVRIHPRPPEGFAPFAQCAATGYPHAAVYRNARDDQACWHVRPVNLGLAGEPPLANQVVAAFAEGGGLTLPATMVGVRYVATSGGARRQIEYLFNPDLLAPAAGGRLWRPTDWTRSAVAGDPRRRAMVTSLSGWGERWSIAVLPSPGV